MSDKFSEEDLDKFKTVFKKYGDAFLSEFYEIDNNLKERYPELSTTERIEHVVAICSLILGFDR